MPSWCDRILFKSTVKPDPEPKDDTPSVPRTAVSLLAQAWRTFRRTSSASLCSTATAATTVSTTSATSSIASSSATMSPKDSEPESPATARPSQQQLQPPPPPRYVPRRQQARPRSIDVTALQAVPLAPSRPTASPARSASSSTPARTRGSRLTEATVVFTSVGGCSPSFRAMVRRRETWTMVLGPQRWLQRLWHSRLMRPLLKLHGRARATSCASVIGR